MELIAEGLQRGVEAHLLRPVDERNEAFAFRHALLRDAAYASLLRSARQPHRLEGGHLLPVLLAVQVHDHPPFR